MTNDKKSSGRSLEDRYLSALEDAKWRMSNQGLPTSTFAYEYGVLVVKNAFLISGGGLFFVPTMVGLTPDVDLAPAFTAGLLFFLSVLTTLIAASTIHLNWSFHAAAWNQTDIQQKIDIRRAFGISLEGDEVMKVAADTALKRLDRQIFWTYWIPHVLGVIYLCVLILAVIYLYLSFDLVWQRIGS